MHACRLDLLQMQCRAWTGRLVAVVYLPLREGGTVISWDERIDGVSVLNAIRVLSRFYDGLDPVSEFVYPPDTLPISLGPLRSKAGPFCRCLPGL